MRSGEGSASCRKTKGLAVKVLKAHQLLIFGAL
jgi:hypothetical protein